MKKNLLCIILVVILIVALCGCNKKENNTSSEEPNTEIVSTYEATEGIDVEVPTESAKSFSEPTINETEGQSEIISNEPVYFENEYGTYRKVNEQVITEGNVYLRSRPNGKKVVSVNMNVWLTRVGIGEENGWSIVLYKDKEVYIPTYYVSPGSTAKYEEVDEIVYTTEEVNFRSGASIRSSNLGKFLKNSKLTRVGIGDNGWSKILYNDEIVYVYSLYLRTEDKTSETTPDNIGDVSANDETEPQDEPESIETEPQDEIPVEELTAYEENGVIYTVVDEIVEASRTVNVRKFPDAKSEKLGQLAGAKTIKRIAIGDNGWSKVLFRGEEAYIKSEYLLTR